MDDTEQIKPCQTYKLEKLRQKLHVLEGEQPREGREGKERTTKIVIFKLTIFLSGFPDYTEYFEDMYGETSVWGLLLVWIFVLCFGGDEEKEEEEISKET